MQKVNLRDLYPDVYKRDILVDVDEMVLAALKMNDKLDASHERQKYRYKAHYSLDCGDGIEHDVLIQSQTPEELFEQKQLCEEIRAALMQLPVTQARRIYARFYLDMAVSEIARIEGVDRRRVWASIRRGLNKLAELLNTDK